MKCAQPSGSTTALGPAGPSATTNGNPDNGQDNNGMYDLDHDGGHEHTEGSGAMRDEDGNGPGGDRDHNHNEDG